MFALVSIPARSSRVQTNHLLRGVIESRSQWPPGPNRVLPYFIEYDNQMFVICLILRNFRPKYGMPYSEEFIDFRRRIDGQILQIVSGYTVPQSGILGN